MNQFDSRNSVSQSPNSYQKDLADFLDIANTKSNLPTSTGGPLAMGVENDDVFQIKRALYLISEEPQRSNLASSLQNPSTRGVYDGALQNAVEVFANNNGIAIQGGELSSQTTALILASSQNKINSGISQSAEALSQPYLQNSQRVTYSQLNGNLQQLGIQLNELQTSIVARLSAEPGSVPAVDAHQELREEIKETRGERRRNRRRENAPEPEATEKQEAGREIAEAEAHEREIKTSGNFDPFEDVQTLSQAAIGGVLGLGTDEASIVGVLNNRTPDQIEVIREVWKERFIDQLGYAKDFTLDKVILSEYGENEGEEDRNSAGKWEQTIGTTSTLQAERVRALLKGDRLSADTYQLEYALNKGESQKVYKIVKDHISQGTYAELENKFFASRGDAGRLQVQEGVTLLQEITTQLSGEESGPIQLLVNSGLSVGEAANFDRLLSSDKEAALNLLEENAKAGTLGQVKEVFEKTSSKDLASVLEDHYSQKELDRALAYLGTTQPGIDQETKANLFLVADAAKALSAIGTFSTDIASINEIFRGRSAEDRSKIKKFISDLYGEDFVAKVRDCHNWNPLLDEFSSARALAYVERGQLTPAEEVVYKLKVDGDVSGASRVLESIPKSEMEDFSTNQIAAVSGGQSLAQLVDEYGGIDKKSLMIASRGQADSHLEQAEREVEVIKLRESGIGGGILGFVNGYVGYQGDVLTRTRRNLENQISILKREGSSVAGDNNLSLPVKFARQDQEGYQEAREGLSDMVGTGFATAGAMGATAMTGGLASPLLYGTLAASAGGAVGYTGSKVALNWDNYNGEYVKDTTIGVAEGLGTLAGGKLASFTAARIPKLAFFSKEAAGATLTTAEEIKIKAGVQKAVKEATESATEFARKSNKLGTVSDKATASMDNARAALKNVADKEIVDPKVTDAAKALSEKMKEFSEGVNKSNKWFGAKEVPKQKGFRKAVLKATKELDDATFKYDRSHLRLSRYQRIVDGGVGGGAGGAVRIGFDADTQSGLGNYLDQVKDVSLQSVAAGSVGGFMIGGFATRVGDRFGRRFVRGSRVHSELGELGSDLNVGRNNYLSDLSGKQNGEAKFSAPNSPSMDKVASRRANLEVHTIADGEARRIGSGTTVLRNGDDFYAIDGTISRTGTELVDSAGRKLRLMPGEFAEVAEGGKVRLGEKCDLELIPSNADDASVFSKKLFGLTKKEGSSFTVGSEDVDLTGVVPGTIERRHATIIYTGRNANGEAIFAVRDGATSKTGTFHKNSAGDWELIKPYTHPLPRGSMVFDGEGAVFRVPGSEAKDLLPDYSGKVDAVKYGASEKQILRMNRGEIAPDGIRSGAQQLADDLLPGNRVELTNGKATLIRSASNPDNYELYSGTLNEYRIQIGKADGEVGLPIEKGKMVDAREGETIILVGRVPFELVDSMDRSSPLKGMRDGQSRTFKVGDLRNLPEGLNIRGIEEESVTVIRIGADEDGVVRYLVREGKIDAEGIATQDVAGDFLTQGPEEVSLRTGDTFVYGEGIPVTLRGNPGPGGA